MSNESRLKQISDPTLMQTFSNQLRKEEKIISFVPTMGGLHDGHLSLVEEAKKRGDITIVSIFVNPSQFGENEDYDEYTRDIDGDKEKLNKLGVKVVFTPSVEDIYPKGFQTFVEVTELQNCLCGLYRPGHFKGVATVVLKLFNIVKPHIAVFGEKDFQQLQIIKRMVSDLNVCVEIVGMPIVREEGGLAISSRNMNMSAEERERAQSISKALYMIRDEYENGCKQVEKLIDIGVKILTENYIFNIDYFEIRDSISLELIKEAKPGSLVAVAVRLGETRLVDSLML